MSEEKKVTWTKDQEKAITAHGCNLLVSAAAGSGKTAVLVERVIRMITDDLHPVDIDRLMVVTFTNAAAGEMKERILAAVEKKLDEEPENGHLQRQMAYINHADITTLHSFCLKVIRENFDRISMDPGFRIGEPGELELIRQDAIAEVIESAYENGSEDFYRFVESYAPEKSDEVLNDLILQFYDAAVSRPDPEEWLNSCREISESGADLSGADDDRKTEEENISGSLWMEKLLAHAARMVEDIRHRILKAIQIASSPGGPFAYLPALESDLEIAEKLENCRSYEAYTTVFLSMEFARLKVISKKENVDPGKKNLVSAMRKEWKDQLNKLRDDYFSKDLSSVLMEERLSREPLNVLVELTSAFANAYREQKSEKNLVDFHDLEHLALDILCDRTEDGAYVPSEVARGMAAEIDEIMVDEYQDINLLQDLIIKSVSREADGTPNVFMVGDVKQSIYRFRLARPELFMEKYGTYAESGNYRRVILGQNFRSRSEVLSDINFVFRQIMTRDLGGISYEDDQALWPGAFYPELPAGQDNSTEICVITQEDDFTGRPSDGKNVPPAAASDGETMSHTTSADHGEDPRNVSSAETEGRFIARKIKAMMRDHFQVFDKDEKRMRDLTPGDVVVLVRTMKGFGESLSDTLMACGVPAYCETTTGYFNTVEVRTVLHLLKALDNPRDDISLTAVLKSPIGGFSSEDLAWMKAKGGKPCFYDCCMEVLSDRQTTAANPEEPRHLKDRLREFFRRFADWRRRAPLISLYQLIDEVLEESGYRYYVAAMPSGERRLKNIEMLMEKAAVYEESSYRGLFRFVRYIEKLREYEVDFGEATSDEGVGHVRVMSIHKSKGLEFPVVFVAGITKNFNFRDSSRTLLIHPDLGIGTDSFDLDRRLIFRSLKKKVIGSQITEERLAEELCVLYVAATRAKEKLIFVGYEKNSVSDRFEKYLYLADEEDEKLPYAALRGARCFLDFLLMGLMRCSCMKGMYEDTGREPPSSRFLYGEKTNLKFLSVPAGEIGQSKQEEEAEYARERAVIRAWDLEAAEKSRTAASPEGGSEKDSQGNPDAQWNPFRFDYPFREATAMIGKYSVSDIKHRYMDTELPEQEETRAEIPLFYKADPAEPGKEPAVPAGPGQSFDKSVTTDNPGARRGTAYHKILELWDYSLPPGTAEDVRNRIRDFAAEKRIPAEYEALVSPETLLPFFTSPLGLRMKRAAEKHCLRRERQFVMGLPAKDIGVSETSEEMILIQGMVDACFEEDGSLVLVDYKTDRLYTREAFLARYQVQLELYAHALEAAYGKPVKQKIIYSFEMEEEIDL